MSDRKINFCSKFAVKLEIFRVTVADAVFVSHAGVFWTKSYGLNCTKFWTFWKPNQTKPNQTKQTTYKLFLKLILIKRWHHFGRGLLLFDDMKPHQCFKYYGGPTLVTRLKVVPNMADQISLKNSGSCFKIRWTCDLYWFYLKDWPARLYKMIKLGG